MKIKFECDSHWSSHEIVQDGSVVALRLTREQGGNERGAIIHTKEYPRMKKVFAPAVKAS